MGSFDDREQAFEKKHAHDAEMVFRATARRNKLLGLWAAERMGRDAAGAAAYAKEIVAAGLSREGDAAVAERLRADLEAAGADSADIPSRMDALSAEAKAQVMAEVKD